MKKLITSTLLVSSIGLLSAAPFASADEQDFQDGYAKGMHDLEDKMNYRLGGVNDAIDENAAAIGANTTAINTNSAAIGENSSAIGVTNAAVEENAAAITALQAGEPTYNYSDYSVAANIASKTYNIRNISGCDTETRLFSRITSGDVTDITMTRVRTVAGGPCRYHTFTFRATPDGYYRTGTQSFNRSGSTLNSTVTLDSPALMRSSSMEIGKASADATTTTLTDSLGNFIASGTYVQKTLLASVESVTVPYNGGTKFEGCIKTQVMHHANISFGAREIERVEWHCPGIGMVKRIHGDGGYFELNNITYQ